MKKQCIKCKQWFPATREYFYIHKQSKSGLKSACKKCYNKANAKWQKENRDKRNEYQRQWRKQNRKKHNEWKRQYRKQNQDKLNKQRKKWERKYYKTIKGHLSHTWSNINWRCYGKNGKDYHRYGGRGIENRFKSLDEFRDYIINELEYDSYEKIKGLQIDRIDNNGHYEKGNIRFVTPKVNANNRRYCNV